jgi:hypothetical protein
MRIDRFLLIPAAALFATSLSAATPKEENVESPAYVQAESARLVVPAAARSTDDVKVLLVTVVPANAACYESGAEATQVDKFTHVISARARAILDDAACAGRRRSRYEFQTFDLGSLAPGTHVIKVEDSVAPVAPVTLVVTDGSVAQNH